MALSDIYYQQPWDPKAGVGQSITQGLGQAAAIPMQQAQLQAQQQANTDAAYNSPARPANAREADLGNRVLDLFPGPKEFKDKLHTELTTPGLAPGGSAAPGQTGSTFRGGDGADMQPQVPQVNVTQGGSNGMRTPLPASSAFAQARNPPPTAPAGPQGVTTETPMTRGDLDTYLRTAPIIKAEKPGRDYMAEIAARGTQGQLLEQLRQKGKLSMADIRNAQRTLELATKTALDQRKLDETTKYHIDQIQLGYDRIQAMLSMMDKNIDFKRTQGADQMLKSATSILDSMSSSESALIGSAFSGTPEGQVALAHMRAAQEKAQALINERMAQDQGAPPTTTTTTRTSRSSEQGARAPTGVTPPPPTPDQGTPEIPVFWKNRKTGKVLKATQSQVDSADDKADWVRQ